MKLMFFKHLRTSLLSAGVFSLILSSCTKVEDLYKAPEGESSKLITDMNVSDGFNWATTTSVDVRVAVQDQRESNNFYKLEVYDREPYALGASLLAGGSVKKGEQFSAKATVPTALAFVYVKQTSPWGIVSYYMVEIVNGVVSNVNKGFAKSASVSGVRKFAATTMNVFAGPQPTPAPKVPATATAVTNSTKIDWAFVNTNRSLVIRPGVVFSKELLLNNGITGVTVYVEGEWDYSGKTIEVGAENTVVVMPGGKLKSKSLTQNTVGEMANYGTVTLEELKMANSSKYENYGALTISKDSKGTFNGVMNNWGVLTFDEGFKLTTNGARVFNAGTFKVDGIFELASGGLNFDNVGVAEIKELYSTSNDVIVTNHPGGALVVDKLDFTNATLNANCKTDVGQMDARSGAKINVATGARLNVGKLITYSGGPIFTLAQGSIMDVTTSAKFSGWKADFVGASALNGSDVKPLLRVKTIESLGKGGLKVEYQGYLEVATTSHPSIGNQYDPTYKAASTVSFVDYDKVSVFIGSTACNAGGIGTSNPGNPVDQILEEVVLGTYSYAFEDNWPVTGDYDMNDIVVDVQIIQHKNKSNKIEKVVLRNSLRSVGASKRLAVAIQLDNVLANAVKNVVYSNTSVVGKVLPLAANNVESGQSKAVVTIVDDAHKAFGFENTPFIFTHDGKQTPFTSEISIEFLTPIESLTYSDLNPFIVSANSNNAGRYEVHLVGKSATDKINKMLLSSAQGDQGTLSKNDPFKSKGNEPFALSLPLSFQYPYEGQNISELYPNMKPWIQSNGGSFQDWYIR